MRRRILKAKTQTAAGFYIIKLKSQRWLPCCLFSVNSCWLLLIAS